MNFSKSGVGASAGTRGMRIGIGPRGLRTSVGIPGTGVYYEKRTKLSSSSTKNQSSTNPYIANILNRETKDKGEIKLSFFKSLTTPPAERDFIEGINFLLKEEREDSIHALREALKKDPSMADAAFIIALISKDDNERLKSINLIFENLKEFGKYFDKYNVTIGGRLKVTEELIINVMNDITGLTLLAAEIYQDAGRINEAIKILKKSDLIDDRLVKLSLGELYYENGEYENCIDTLQGIDNVDELGTVALLYLAFSFRELDLYDSAVETLRRALRRKKDRSEELLLTCRFELAETFTAMGEKRKAKVEYEKVAAVDSKFRDALQKARKI